MRVYYICVSLGVPEPDFLLSVLTVAPPIKEGIIKYLIKEGTFSQVKGTQMYCQETSREMVGVGPLMEVLA